MKPTRLSFCVLFVLSLVASNAFAWQRLKATTFAELPAGFVQPEGITADAFGNLYVASFDPLGASSTSGQIAVFNHAGRLARVLSVENSSPALLGLAFHPKTHALLVLDFGAHQVLKVNPFTGASTVFATMGAAAGLNALTFDHHGNVYISDSFQGIIWRTGPQGGTPTAWVQNPLLTTTGIPPFGANGVAFNKHESALFVANTGDDSVVRIPVASGTPGTPEVLVYGINGADGLIIDRHDNIWVAANQSDEIVVIDPTGRPLAKLGDFDGIRHDGSPRGLLFPASLVRSFGSIYITNLSLDLRSIGGPQTLNSQPSADVGVYTVARLPAVIPPLH